MWHSCVATGKLILVCTSPLTSHSLRELVCNSTFDPASNVSHATPIRRRTAANGLKFINFHLPHTKTKETGEDVNITDSTCQCSPTTTLEHYLASNSAVPTHSPLSTFNTGADSWSPMSRSWFLRRCNDIWEKDDLSSVKGHAFHIGGTTHLLLLGIDPWVVMVQGRWSSQSFLTYWRKCEEILSLFIGFSFQSQESVLSTMCSFKSKLTS